MKRTAEAARLQAVLYLKTGKVVMPGLALLIFLVSFYSVGPVDLVDSTVLTTLALALVMTWAGLSFARAEEPIVSQLLQLKLHSPAREIASRAILLMIFSLIAALLSAAWPLGKNLISEGAFFTRAVTGADIWGMLGLFFSASVMGGAFGALFHPRIFRDTRAAWLIALLGCLLGAYSGIISNSIPVFGFAAWLLPPLHGIITRFDAALSFDPAALAKTLIACWAYALGAFALKSLLLRRIRF